MYLQSQNNRCITSQLFCANDFRIYLIMMDMVVKEPKVAQLYRENHFLRLLKDPDF